MTGLEKDAKIIELIADNRNLKAELNSVNGEILTTLEIVNKLIAENMALTSKVRMLQHAERDTVSEAMDRDAERGP